MSMRSLKLNFRTTLCFGVVCFLLLIQGAMTLIKVDQVYSSTVEIDTNWLPSIRLAGQIDTAFYKLRLDLRRYAMEYGAKDPASLEKVKAVRDEAVDSLKVAHEAGVAITQITQAITDINERNLMIATASEQQAQVARSVDQNLISIRDLSIQSSSAAGQTSIASQELSRLAVDLKQIVAKFSVS
ncbi:MCP four helix bundle domain-containing protein [Pseudomonas sp. ICBG1301]|nr:MCP four helix bundle domain-containing protein [Pseudomonas sp. ICBG1301]MBM9484964.1 MCP four helix bundle domain-containing protein [Pseudomonas sp. ICBG1301]